MGSLRTFVWIKVDGVKQFKEIVFPISNISYATAFEDSGGSATSLLVLEKTNTVLHVDIPIKRLYKIIGDSERKPYLDFDTHPGIEEYSKKSFCDWEHTETKVAKSNTSTIKNILESKKNK